MTLGFVVYSIAVALLLAAAARAGEAALGALGRPRRWVWVIALAGAVTLPIAAPLRSAPEPLPSPVQLRLSAVESPSGDAVVAAESRVDALVLRSRALLEAPVAGLGTGARLLSLLALLMLAGGVLRLRLEGRRWPASKVADRDVRLTDGFGPALVGLLRPRIALPRSALELGDEHLAMIVLHEEEHRRAGDPWLLWGSAAALCLQPWNPGLWLLAARLRQAVETDCDARVLANGISAARYGWLLLHLQTEHRLMHAPAAMMGARGTSLERRLKMMKTRFESPNRGRALALGVAATALAAVACDTPTPAAVAAEPRAPEAAARTITAEETEVPIELLDENGETTAIYVEEIPHAVYETEGEVVAAEELRAREIDGEERHFGQEIEIPVAATFEVREIDDGERHFGDDSAGTATYDFREIPADDPPAGGRIEERGTASFEVRELGFGPAGALHQETELSLSEAAFDGNRPLIVVDGVITSKELAEIAEMQPRTVEIVKGAAAARLYGSRARNGVVMITTEEGSPAPEGSEASSVLRRRN